MQTDILLIGTGAFAARIAFDCAATARHPVRIAIAGRNPDRLGWLHTASAARAAMFGTPARFVARQVDAVDHGTVARLLEEVRPSVVVQAASIQTSAVIATRGDAWSELVSEGGLSATAVFQAALSADVARAVRDAHPVAAVVNCCFPDVVNGLLRAAGLPVTCGIGNVGILSNAFAGAAAETDGPVRLQMLAHYQQLGQWRRAPAARGGTPPRVWLNGDEVADPFARFRQVLLTPEPAIDISGASGVPLLLAMAAGEGWRGHVPGPEGRPGGYPVRWQEGSLALDLPPGLDEADAVRWNAAFENRSGLVIDGSRARYTGVLAERLRALAPELADGFDVSDLPDTLAATAWLRDRLAQRPARHGAPG